MSNDKQGAPDLSHTPDSAAPHPFMDEETVVEIDWSAIWSQLQPASPYGRRRKQSAKPFLPGQEHLWQSDLQQLRADIEHWDLQTVKTIRQRLDGVPDVTDLLRHLPQQTSPLGKKDLLSLKHVAHLGCHLLEEDALRGWSQADTWRGCLRLFGEVETRGFAIEHIATEAYRAEMQRLSAYQGVLARTTRERDVALVNEFNIRPNREGRLSVSLPNQKDVAERLKANSNVNWLRDTPFESVFEALSTSDMVQAITDIEQCKQRLDVFEQEALQQMTDTIRAHLPEWLTLAEDLAALDWRLAKVMLAHQWAGVVPEAGEGLDVVEAVHPLVANRLAASGRSYVPLTFHPAYGVNVICGSNMGGKTVTMTLVCILQALAQYGLPVPVRGFQTRLFEIIRFSSAASTDAANGLSSFGREMVRLAEVWEAASRCQTALICLDEPGRSTNPTEGEALVVGILKSFLHSSVTRQSVTLIATHFAAPIRESGITTFRVKGIREDALHHIDETVGLTTRHRLGALEAAMDYRVESAPDGKRPEEGLRIARWLGVPNDILRESESFLRRGKSL